VVGLGFHIFQQHGAAEILIAEEPDRFDLIQIFRQQVDAGSKNKTDYKF